MLLFFLQQRNAWKVTKKKEVESVILYVFWMKTFKISPRIREIQKKQNKNDFMYKSSPFSPSRVYLT